ncbi:MAG: hypothetical protein QM756_37335 [Polyangiaceae bacterium]
MDAGGADRGGADEGDAEGGAASASLGKGGGERRGLDAGGGDEERTGIGEGGGDSERGAEPGSGGGRDEEAARDEDGRDDGLLEAGGCEELVTATGGSALFADASSQPESRIESSGTMLGSMARIGGSEGGADEEPPFSGTRGARGICAGGFELLRAFPAIS